MQNEDLGWIEKAEDHLKYIQQKQLFNKQCLWRAEQLAIPQIELCFEFDYWEQNILNCPFLEPISSDDLELYIDFLNQSDEQFDFYFECDWQDYDEMIKEFRIDNAYSVYPEWYEYYDMRRGTGALMQLQNIRGNKEKFYTDIQYQAHKAEHEESTKEFERRMATNLNYYEDGFMDWYTTNYEDKETQKLYKAYEWYNRNNGDEEEIEKCVRLLFSSNEPIAIETNANWITAIKNAANKYRNKKIAEALPHVYQQYLINIEIEIPFATNKHDEMFKDLKTNYAKRIIEGRVLNGEPADLNF